MRQFLKALEISTYVPLVVGPRTLRSILLLSLFDVCVA